MQSVIWYRIPSRQELRRRKWEKKKAEDPEEDPGSHDRRRNPAGNGD